MGIPVGANNQYQGNISNPGSVSPMMGKSGVAWRTRRAGDAQRAQFACLDLGMSKPISQETIYAAIYIVPRGELRRTFLSYLRQHRKLRRPRSRGDDRRGQIPNRTAIALRPPEVASRLVPCHWEGDLIKGKANGSVVGTLVERATRLVVMARMDGLDSDSVCRGFERKLRLVPQVLRKSLTYD